MAVATGVNSSQFATANDDSIVVHSGSGGNGIAVNMSINALGGDDVIFADHDQIFLRGETWLLNVAVIGYANTNVANPGNNTFVAMITTDRRRV